MVHFISCYGYNVDRMEFPAKRLVSRQQTRPNGVIPKWLHFGNVVFEISLSVSVCVCVFLWPPCSCVNKCRYIKIGIYAFPYAAIFPFRIRWMNSLRDQHPGREALYTT